MSTEPLSSDALSIVRRVIEFVLMLCACVALHALSPDPFYAGWFGGALFATVFWRPWVNLK